MVRHLRFTDDGLLFSPKPGKNFDTAILLFKFFGDFGTTTAACSYNGKEMGSVGTHSVSCKEGRGIFMSDPKMINPSGGYTRPGAPVTGGPNDCAACPSPSSSDNGAHCFKEAVCIDANRVYDSCSDKDCLEDLPVLFTDQEQPYIDQAVSLKVREVEVSRVFLEVEPVAFNRGFYSVDMTFFFHVCLSVYTSSAAQPVTGQWPGKFFQKGDPVWQRRKCAGVPLRSSVFR